MEQKNELISRCGLYCGACKKYLKNICSGCRTKAPPSWCEVSPCAASKDLFSCADCSDFPDVYRCGRLYPFKYRFGEWVAGMSRKAGIEMIRTDGCERYVQFMVEENRTLCVKKRRLKRYLQKTSQT
jgi:hypothetical protein